jgi:hypothetical protein
MSVRKEAANRVTIYCWYQRQCGAVPTGVRASSEAPRGVAVWARDGRGGVDVGLGATRAAEAPACVRALATHTSCCIVSKWVPKLRELRSTSVKFRIQRISCWNPSAPKA